MKFGETTCHLLRVLINEDAINYYPCIQKIYACFILTQLYAIVKSKPLSIQNIHRLLFLGALASSTSLSLAFTSAFAFATAR